VDLLEVRGLTKRFGGVVALDGVDVAVPSGSIVSIIGPNGAGKTTFFNVVSGLLRPNAGTVTLAGHRLDGLRPDQIASLGVARTFQNLRLFGRLTAEENVLIGAHCQGRASLLAALVRSPGAREEEGRLRRRAREALAFVGLERRRTHPAGSLPYGAQRRLEIARALASGPRLLLLDEPTAGMTPEESADLMGLIERIRRLGITVVVIAHDMQLVRGLSDRIVALHHGRKIADGPPAAVMGSREVIDAYLGSEDDALV
jgi:branched-chain amino acid transport system ATP-binding protein